MILILIFHFCFLLYCLFTHYHCIKFSTFWINPLFFQYSMRCTLKFNLFSMISRMTLPLLFHFQMRRCYFIFQTLHYCFIFQWSLLLFHFSIDIVIVFHFLNCLYYCLMSWQKYINDQNEWRWFKNSRVLPLFIVKFTMHENCI